MSNAQLLWFNAVACNRIDDIRHHLSKYGKTFNKDSETALMIAVRLNNLDIAKILLDVEATLTNSDGRTALMIAAICGHTELAHLLVEKEARIQDNYGMTALMFAIICENKSIVELLVNHESGLSTTKEVMIGCLNDNHIDREDNSMDALSDSSSVVSNNTPTYASFDRDRRKVIVHRRGLSYCKRISPYYSIPIGYTSVLFAILCGDVDSVRLLNSEYNTSIYNKHLDRFITPHILSVESRQIEVIKTLVSSGPGLLVEPGYCALYDTILQGEVHIISLLFECEKHFLKHESISMPSTMILLIEQVVAHNPNYEGNPIFTEFLDSLFKSSNVREKDKHGMTLLMMGAALNLAWLVQAILDAVPDALTDIDCQGRSALHYAAAAVNSVDAGKVLKKRLIGSMDAKNYTSLMTAAMHGNSAMIKSLRNESKLIDKQGQSALMLLILGAASCPFREQQDMTLDSAKYLIEEEAGMINNASRSALMLSIWHRFYDLALQLTTYEKGYQDKSGNTALILAIYVNCNNIALIDRLSQTESLMRLNNQFGGGKSPLMIAIERDSNHMMLDSLLKSQFATGLIDAAGHSALMYAIEQKNIEIGLRLAHVPAELGHACFAKRQTALMKAILSKQDDVAVVLAYRKPELCKQDYKGRTALMHAIDSKNETLALILSESEQGYRDASGKTALVHAIEKRPSLLYRLDLWSEVLICDKEGLLPLDYARQCRSELVQVKNRHTNTVTTHNLQIDLIVHSMEVPLTDSVRIFKYFKEYMYRVYDRMALFARQLLVRRHADRQIDTDRDQLNNNSPLDNTNAILSPTLSYHLMFQESPVISQWSTGILQIADILLDTFAYDWYSQEFYTDIPSLLDEYLRTIKTIEDCHTLRDDDLYEDYCCICMDAPVRVVLLPCRHAVLCERCNLNIKKTCPICRHKVTGQIDIDQ